MPQHVLFIGNSYLYYNDSVHNHVRRMAEEQFPDKRFQYKSATIGGASLKQHPIEILLQPGRLGIEEPFDYVILQGGSGEVRSLARRQAFQSRAGEMIKLIRSTGATPALYMIHAYVPPHRNYDPDMINQIRSEYDRAGKQNRTLVIPVGLAFQLSYQRRPQLSLHKTFDGTHPSLYGTYLAACVVYATLYGRPASKLAYDYFGAIDAENAAYLRRIADEVVAEYSQPASAGIH